MLKAYKYRIYPTDSQKETLAKFFGASRFIYNLGLETKIAAWTSAKKNVTCFDLMKQLTELKHTDCQWLNECSVPALQQSLRVLDNAYTRFFKGGGFPKFKKRSGRQSIRFPNSYFVGDTTISIPKIKNIPFIKHRPLGKGKLGTITISKESSGAYFASILVDNGKELPKKKRIKESTAVGIDVGLKTFATLSDGQSFENPKYLHEQLKRLRIEQRKLKRRFKKGAKQQSKGYEKQKLVVAKLYEKIANKRKDFLHKTSAAITKQYDTICLENLNIGGMMKSNLAKSVSDVSWYEFGRMLEYKAEWNGKNILRIGRFEPSSKICSNCGNIFKELTLADRNWTCEKCGTNHDRDHNAAINIKNFGLKARPSTAKTSH